VAVIDEIPIQRDVIIWSHAKQEQRLIMNKKITYFLLLIFMITGCASHEKEQIKIATATKSLGEAYMAQGKHIAALKELLDAEKIIPRDPFLQYDLGLVYMARGKYDLAERHLEKAIALKNDYTEAKNSLGIVFMKQKKWDDAISMFQRIADNLLYATPHYPLSNMGWAFLGKGDLKNAEVSFKKALTIKPNFINAIHGLAATYLAQNQITLARQLLDEAILKYPDEPFLHADLAKTLEAQGLPKEATQSWQQVITLVSPAESELKKEAAKQLRRLSSGFQN